MSTGYTILTILTIISCIVAGILLAQQPFPWWGHLIWIGVEGIIVFKFVQYYLDKQKGKSR